MHPLTQEFIDDVVAIVRGADFPPDEAAKLIELAISYAFRSGQIDEMERIALVNDLIPEDLRTIEGPDSLFPPSTT